MKRSAIYPGTFDPVTYGHLDLIHRATTMFDRVIVAVAQNGHKKPLFSLEERYEMIRGETKQFPSIEVQTFEGLVVDFARKNGIYILIRGLRMLSDFEYEFQMALTNRRLADDIETVFLMPSESYSFLSSKLLKEAAVLGADLSSFVPGSVAARLKEKFKR